MDSNRSSGENLDFVSRAQRRRQLQMEIVEKFVEDVQSQIQSINRTLEQGEPVDPEGVKELRALFAAFDEFLSSELYALGDIDAPDLDTLEYPPIEDRL